MKSHERNKERKFSRGGSSSGKRTRESQVDSVQGSSTRGRSNRGLFPMWKHGPSNRKFSARIGDF